MVGAWDTLDGGAILIKKHTAIARRETEGNIPFIRVEKCKEGE